MDKQFTASEVRELAATIWPDLSGREEVAEALNAFADLLEVREKSMPVVTRESAINAIEHVGRHNGPGRETEARQMLVEGPSSVAHRAPADAERLAEALQEGYESAHRGVQKLIIHPDAPNQTPKGWCDLPFALIDWSQDDGDSSVGMQGWSAWTLHRDQKGTVVGALLEFLDEMNESSLWEHFFDLYQQTHSVKEDDSFPLEVEYARAAITAQKKAAKAQPPAASVTDALR